MQAANRRYRRRRNSFLRPQGRVATAPLTFRKGVKVRVNQYRGIITGVTKALLQAREDGAVRPIGLHNALYTVTIDLTKTGGWAHNAHQVWIPNYPEEESITLQLFPDEMVIDLEAYAARPSTWGKQTLQTPQHNAEH